MGTVTDPQTVRLGEALPLSAGRMRLYLEPISEPAPRPSYEVLAESRRGQEAREYKPPTREEVDRYLNEERESWE